MKIFYAAGPGDIISAHKHWMRGVEDPSQMALTYSGQFADFCRDIGASAHFISYSSQPGTFRDGDFLLQHVPKKSLGPGAAGYHLSELLYAIKLLSMARGSDIAFVDTGTTHHFALWAFRAFGIKVVPILHNTLWPAGYPRGGAIQNLLRKLDATFFKFGSNAALGVSPECIRQVEAMGGTSIPRAEFKGQFIRSYFETMPNAPTETRPFRLLFAGRIQENKGVFDILKMAEKINGSHPGLVEWDICGRGLDLEALRSACKQAGLENIVKIHGHLAPAGMRSMIANSHASIVPTKSTFAEGMALSAVEPILSGRPVITCSVVPALEVLRPACLEAKTDDVDSYVARVIELATSKPLYDKLCSESRTLGNPFYDRKQGLATALKAITAAISGR